jgi:hypothetical protein
MSEIKIRKLIGLWLTLQCGKQKAFGQQRTSEILSKKKIKNYWVVADILV